MGYFEEKIKGIPGPGNRQIAAERLAQVPIDLMALAKDLEDQDPKIAISVIKRSVPSIKEKVQALTVNKDSDSDYSAKLDRWEQVEQQKRDSGYKRVPEEEWQGLQDELEALKEEHEDIIYHHKKLLKKYDAIKAKRGAMSQQQRDGLEAQVEELRGQIALKEKQLSNEKKKVIALHSEYKELTEK